MKTRRRPLGIPTRVKRFLESDDPRAGWVRDALWVVGVVAGIALLLFLASGTWPAVVAVESESMVPNMNVGDLVFVAAFDRYGELTSWEEGEATGYVRFGDSPDLQGNQVYGDVIIFRPNGDDAVHPIIHRAISWYDDNTTASGYITKGDNNPSVDQVAYYPTLGQIQPVREEWIVGKAIFRIPLVGYFPLHIVEFAIVIIILMVVWEWYSRRREAEKEAEKDEESRSAEKKAASKGKGAKKNGSGKKSPSTKK
ncbi:S24/S26 family peptidase [Methanovulcanius yangii]|uniref:S26 family signal peptidase n=1 Tax=Methanovulcanius yangii TaxID=1789227 RepID=UPI0029C9DDC2|nr:S26 family signal peptidase [Methanovulcanius yangii]